jgi:hypothetical protein
MQKPHKQYKRVIAPYKLIQKNNAKIVKEEWASK